MKWETEASKLSGFGMTYYAKPSVRSYKVRPQTDGKFMAEIDHEHGRYDIVKGCDTPEEALRFCEWVERAYETR